MFVKFDISTWSPSSLKLSQLKHELADHEVTRIERFLFQADQNRALIGQILVRRLIASLLPPSEIDNIIISRTEHGKPYLVRMPSICEFLRVNWICID
jgi:phosphopantetheinyl transferase